MSLPVVPAYHAYFAYSSNDETFDTINSLVQLASVLFWKKHFGPIHLVCNETHLRIIKEHGIDKAYDSVQTDLLESLPIQNDRYWSFAKIHLAYTLSEAQKGPFVILDNDLWVSDIPDTFDASCDLMGLHYEGYDLSYRRNPYVDPEYFMPGNPKGFDWGVAPVNCAILYFNNSELVREWYNTVLEVIKGNTGKEGLGYSREIVFLEQRLLPTIAEKMGLDARVLVPTTYQTQLDGQNNITPWSPPLNTNEKLMGYANMVKHVWGMKYQYDNDTIRKYVVKTCLDDLEAHFPELINGPFLKLKNSSVRLGE